MLVALEAKSKTGFIDGSFNMPGSDSPHYRRWKKREKVEQLLFQQSTGQAIICDNLKKVYPGRHGNPEKFAVRGISIALPHGECFGMLGPNGAGKTTFINMMIGLTKPSSGTAYVEGFDIQTQMNGIYTIIGVCPQDDLLWKTLTGRKRLLFYGRLKNLKGAALTQLKARYEGSYVFTMTTSADHEVEVENLVRQLSPNAIRTYQISGTQKFELPKLEIKIGDVFQAVENAKSRFTVHAWDLADTTLEDVFIKVARQTQAFHVLS